MLRKIFAELAASAITLALTACGSNGNEQTADAAQAGGKRAVTIYALLADSGLGTILIDFNWKFFRKVNLFIRA